MKTFFALIAAVLTSGCVSTTTRQARVYEEGKICQTILLEQLSLRDTNRLVFVAFRDHSGNNIDPSDAIIAQICAAGISARRVSETGRDRQGSVIDKATGQSGMIYSAGVLRWLNSSTVEVIEESDCGGLCGGSIEFVMEKKNGGWKRTKVEKMTTF